MTRTERFVRAVRCLRRPCDSPIECTEFTGGGIRFTGFAAINCRLFLAVLQEHGKRAQFRLDATVAGVYADCYDDIDPKTVDACTPEQLGNSDEPGLHRASADYSRGPIVYTPYVCHRIRSEEVGRLMLQTRALDIKLDANTLTMMNVYTASTGIVGGLLSQLRTAVRVRGRPAYRTTIRFRSNAPSRKHKVAANRWLRGTRSKKAVGGIY